MLAESDLAFFSRIKIPGFHKSSSLEEDKSDIKVSFDEESPSFDNISSVPNGRTQALTGLMTVTKNPSTVFKPPFGTNADEHHSRLGEHTKHLWKYNRITDLTINLREVQYPCHKTVLSCYSKYFKELLLDEKRTVSVIHLRIPSVTNVAFEVLLAYMYTSELNLTCQNIGEVYTAARKLGIDGALILCTRILTGKSKYDVHSVYVYVTAKKQQLDDCAAKALKIMTKRFEHIVGTPEFLDLDFPQVKEYLCQDVLATRSEVIVYLAALKWLSVKYWEREQYAADLLSSVRFQMMTLNEILACFSPPLLPGILEQKKITDKLLAATCYVAAVTVNEERRFEQYSCKPRKYLLQRETIILWDPSIFDPDRHAMYVEEMAATRIQASYRGYKTRKSIEADRAAGILRQPEGGSYFERNLAGMDEFEPPRDENGDETYISRSDSGSKNSLIDRIRKSVVSFMSSSKEDVEKSGENIPKELDDEDEDISPRKGIVPSVSSSIDTLIGHVNSLSENTEIKRYASDTTVDLSAEAFKQTFPHPKREDAYKDQSRQSSEFGMSRETESSSSESEENQSSSLNTKGYILLTGGFRSDDVEDELEGKKMFLYDSSRNTWEEYGGMGKARHHHCLAYLNEEVYFIGGCNPSKSKAGRMIPEKTCYKLDLQSKEWKKICKMRHNRMYHGTVELDGKIYVVGGKDEKDRLLNSIEVYSPASNKWEELENPLHIPTMGAGVCVHQGKIWVVGGMIQDDKGVVSLLKEVKCYDPEKKRWSQSHGQLPFPRAFSTVVSFENKVYIIGGTSQSHGGTQEELKSVSDVMFYDSSIQEWLSTTQLPYPRHFVETTVLGKDLYVLGGLSSFQTASTDEVIVYDKKSRRWCPRASLPEPLCGFAAVSVPEAPLLMIGGQQ